MEGRKSAADYRAQQEDRSGRSEKNQAAYEFCRAFTKICDIDEKEWGDILDGLQDMLAKIWNKEIEQDKADDERLDRQRSLDMIGYGDQ